MNSQYLHRFQNGYTAAMALTDMGPDDECYDLELGSQEEAVLDAIAFTFYATTRELTETLCEIHTPERMGELLWYTSNGYGTSLLDVSSSPASRAWDTLADNAPSVEVYCGGDDNSGLYLSMYP